MCLSTWAAWPLGSSIVVLFRARRKLVIDPVRMLLPLVNFACSWISSNSSGVIGTLLFLPLLVSVKLT